MKLSSVWGSTKSPNGLAPLSSVYLSIPRVERFAVHRKVVVSCFFSTWAAIVPRSLESLACAGRNKNNAKIQNAQYEMCVPFG